MDRISSSLTIISLPQKYFALCRIIVLTTIVSAKNGDYSIDILLRRHKKLQKDNETVQV